MNQPRDIERLLDLWLADGPTRSPDRVLDVVAGRIGRQPQRAAWRPHPREIHVTTILRAGIAAAAIVVIAIVGFNLVPGSSNGVGGGSPASPPPTLPASALPASAPPAPVPSGSFDPPLPAGPNSSLNFTPTVSYTVPSGFIVWQDTSQTYGVNNPTGNPPRGFFIFRDPAPSTQANGCEGDLNPAVGAYTVDSISSAFAADTRFQVTTPSPVTIGPYTGKTFDLQLAPTWTGTCPWSNGQPAAMVLTVRGGPTPTSPSYGIQSGDQSLRVYLLDVAGTPIWIQIDKSTVDQILPVLQTLSFAS